jgi:hypothetical protein
MNPQDIRNLLERASDHVAEPDLTESTWTTAAGISRRRRRRTALGAALVAGTTVVAVLVGGDRLDQGGEPVGPTQPPPTTVTAGLASAGTIGEVPFWIAPAAGSERWLDPIVTPLGEELVVPDDTLDDLKQRSIRRLAAVTLRRVPGADAYRPALLSGSGRWAESTLELVPTRDGVGNRGLPLDPTAISPEGNRVAFPQPDAVVVLESSSGDFEKIAVPSATIENVAWLPTGDRLLVSGDGASFLVLVGDIAAGEQRVRRIGGTADPWAVTPAALDLTGSAVTMSGYSATGSHLTGKQLALPVGQFYEATIGRRALVARAFRATPTPDLAGHTESATPQMLAVVEAPGDAAKLLIFDENRSSPRASACCAVIGWYDDDTVLFEARSPSGSWLLGWNVRTGLTRRVSELLVDVLAVGPALN